MYPVLLQLGPITIYSFGTFMALAALAAGRVVWMELRRYGERPELASTMVIAAAVGGLIGARILSIIENWSAFLRSPWDHILTGAGFTWYGGLIGGGLAITWVVGRAGIPWRRGADLAAPALAVAYGVGRLGCHVAGDGDWGTVTDVPWGVAYTNAIIGWVHPFTGIPYPEGVTVHPTPIYEFIQSMIIFAILWSVRKKGYREGTSFSLYLVLAGLARFSVEFWRVNAVIALGLTEAQWFSAAMIVLGGYLIYHYGGPTMTSQSSRGSAK